MANNRTPKLAPGSRWDQERTAVITGTSRSSLDVYVDSDGLLRMCSQNDRVAFGCNPRDSLAAIRTAKLDPVFDSSVALAEYWDGLHELFRECLGGESPELYALLSANSAAVKGATE